MHGHRHSLAHVWGHVAWEVLLGSLTGSAHAVVILLVGALRSTVVSEVVVVLHLVVRVHVFDDHHEGLQDFWLLGDLLDGVGLLDVGLDGVLVLGLVSDLLELDFPDFLELVVVDLEFLSVDHGLGLGLVLDSGGFFGVLEADESEFGFGRVNLVHFEFKALNAVFVITKLGEVSSKFFFSGGWAKSFNEKVASLL